LAGAGTLAGGAAAGAADGAGCCGTPLPPSGAPLPGFTGAASSRMV